MAIKYKEVKDKIEKTPLTESELSIIKEVEDLIDNKIKKDFNGGEISIELGTANFTYIQNWNKSPENIPDFRKQLMFKELERRFKAAGWKCVVMYGEDDGPNRPAIDYWVLSGKSRY